MVCRLRPAARGAASRHLQIYEGQTPYQDDYLYMSQDLVPHTRLVRVDRTASVEAVSNHLPSMVDVDPSQTVPARSRLDTIGQLPRTR